MWIKRIFTNLPLINDLLKHKLISGKMLLLLVMLLLGGLTILGCARVGAQAKGWSGGTIDDNTLFLGSMEGKLVAVDISSHNRLFPDVLLETSKPAAGGFGCAAPSTSVAIYGNPAVAGDLVYVGGYNGTIYALNSSSGALRWVYPRQGNLQPIVGAPVVASDKVYFGCSDGKLYALDAATGDKKWEFPTGNKIWSTPAIDANTLYIGSFDNKLYALNIADGSKKWEFQSEGAIVSTPLVYNNTVYIASYGRYLYAVNPIDGSLRWEFLAERGFWAKPVAYNNVIYAPSLDGKVYVIDTESGKEKVAPIDLESPISSSPVLVDSLVIVASDEGKIYAVDTSNNQKRELKNLEEKIIAPLCASNGVVYIHTQEHETLYALNTQTGMVLWSLPIK